MNSSGRSAARSLRKRGVVKVQQAGAEPLRLAVDHVEDFHLLAFRQAEEAHERQHEGEIVEMAKAMLAVYLGEDLRPSSAITIRACGALPRSSRHAPSVRSRALNVSGIVELFPAGCTCGSPGCAQD